MSQIGDDVPTNNLLAPFSLPTPPIQPTTDCSGVPVSNPSFLPLCVPPTSFFFLCLIICLLVTPPKNQFLTFTLAAFPNCWEAVQATVQLLLPLPQNPTHLISPIVS